MRKIRLWENKEELSDHYAIVDDEDYEKLLEAIKYKSGKEGKWYASRSTIDTVYAMSGDRKKSIHRIVMNNPKGMDVDHINGDTLDNRKENLRICTRSQNCRNRKLRADSSTGMKGVYEIKLKRRKYVSKETGEIKYYECKLKKRFQAYIGNPDEPNRHIRIGTYSTLEEAARARDRKALELHGEFAYLNYPREDYE